MKRHIHLALLMTAMAFPAFAQDSDGFVPTSTETHMTQTDGKQIYDAICAGCHMPDGKGAVGAGHYPALSGNANLEAADYPIFVIIHGLKDMPPLGGIMDDAQIAAVVNYIRHDLGNSFEGDTTAEDVKAARE